MPEPITCPVCNQPLRRSTTLIEDAVVLQCRHCRRMAVWVEGIQVEWILGGPDVVQRLRKILEESLTMRAMLTSEEDDPRWRG